MSVSLYCVEKCSLQYFHLENPMAEEPGRLMESQRIRHKWAYRMCSHHTHTHTHKHTHTQTHTHTELHFQQKVNAGKFMKSSCWKATENAKVFYSLRNKTEAIVSLLIFFLSWPHPKVCRILVPQTGIEPAPLSLEGRVFNHWTTREVLMVFLVASISLHIHRALKTKARRRYVPAMPSKPFTSSHMSMYGKTNTIL